MLPRTRSFMLAASLALMSSSAALSQQAPNMVGTWKGTAYAVHIGSNPYRVAEGNGVNFPSNGIEFTYVIREQHGNRFAGELSGVKFKETIIGAIQPDNRGGIMLDDDGQYRFTLADPNTMDVCYSHLYPTSKIAACWRMTRPR